MTDLCSGCERTLILDTYPPRCGTCGKPLHAVVSVPIVVTPTQYAVSYRLHGRIGATTPEPAAGAMRDRYVLQGLGATNIQIVEVKT